MEFNERKIVMESLRTQRKQRDASTDDSLARTSSGGSLHGRAHQTGAGYKCITHTIKFSLRGSDVIETTHILKAYSF